MNQNYRLPEDFTDEMGECYSNLIQEFWDTNGYVGSYETLDLVRDKCGFEFTLAVPERDVPPEYERAPKRHVGIGRLRVWYMRMFYVAFWTAEQAWLSRNLRLWTNQHAEYDPKIKWLERYGFPLARHQRWWDSLTECEKLGLGETPILADYHGAFWLLDILYPHRPIWEGWEPEDPFSYY